jgi:hypothetical protein
MGVLFLAPRSLVRAADWALWASEAPRPLCHWRAGLTDALALRHQAGRAPQRMLMLRSQRLTLRVSSVRKCKSQALLRAPSLAGDVGRDLPVGVLRRNYRRYFVFECKALLLHVFKNIVACGLNFSFNAVDRTIELVIAICKTHEMFIACF